MMRIFSWRGPLAAAGLVAAAGAARAAHAQALASRVSAAPDGPVAFNFPARAGVCGDGRTYVQTGPNAGMYYGGDGRVAPCVPGPVRVVIDRADKLPLSVQTEVGPRDTTRRGITDLGSVRAQDAADYLLSLAQTVDGRAGRDAIFPATLADGANTASTLVTIARNASLARETRQAALSSLGRSTDGMATIPSSVLDPLLALARDENDNQQVRQTALNVMARLEHGAGIPPLMTLSQENANPWLARESMAALARSGDPRARQYLRRAARRTDLPDDVRTTALRALGQEYATAQDAATLREIYPTLTTDRSREAVFSALAEMGGAENVRWLLALARNDATPIQTRRRAVDAASRAGASIADLISLYDTTTDPSMKETLIGVYVRNGEKAAVDKLLAIVKGEDNPAVRRNAIAQLGRSEDPRIRQALQDLVTK